MTNMTSPIITVADVQRQPNGSIGVVRDHEGRIVAAWANNGSGCFAADLDALDCTAVPFTIQDDFETFDGFVAVIVSPDGLSTVIWFNECDDEDDDYEAYVADIERTMAEHVAEAAVGTAIAHGSGGLDRVLLLTAEGWHQSGCNAWRHALAPDLPSSLLTVDWAAESASEVVR